MGVPITFIQVSSIITVMTTAWTLFNKHVSYPNVYIITLECMMTVSTESLAERWVTTVFCLPFITEESGAATNLPKATLLRAT